MPAVRFTGGTVRMLDTKRAVNGRAGRVGENPRDTGRLSQIVKRSKALR